VIISGDGAEPSSERDRQSHGDHDGFGANRRGEIRTDACQAAFFPWCRNTEAFGAAIDYNAGCESNKGSKTPEDFPEVRRCKTQSIPEISRVPLQCKKLAAALIKGSWEQKRHDQRRHQKAPIQSVKTQKRLDSSRWSMQSEVKEHFL
jgi:hypothetical protein